MPLAVQNSCEIDDLINEVENHSDFSYQKIEDLFCEIGIYPENKKTFLTRQFGSIINCLDERPDLQWLENSLQKIFTLANIDSIYVTNPI